MKAVFADTAYYIALSNPKDRWHQAAVDASESCRAEDVTTEFVLVELGNHLSGPVDRALFLSLVETI